MRRRELQSPSRRVRFARTGILMLAALGSFGCSDQGRGFTPTSPAIPPPGATPGFAIWIPESASPAGDCIADALNGWIETGAEEIQFNLEFRREVDEVNLRFQWRPDDNLGFWPLEYDGRIDGDGAIVASLPAARVGTERLDPWLELCIFSWTMEEGRLEARISPDGRHLSGTVVESYRENAQDGVALGTFTVRSRFEAELP